MHKHEYFLNTAIAVGAGATKLNVANFNSKELNLGLAGRGALTLFFARTTGTAYLVKFGFQASVDWGKTWSTEMYIEIEVPTNSLADGNEVRITKEINIYGIGTLRLARIMNSDESNNLTGVNAKLSL